MHDDFDDESGPDGSGTYQAKLTHYERAGFALLNSFLSSKLLTQR